ncbi:MAG: mechanosensitive ion channel domain-containing protein [Pseudomonadota bacterium]
MEWLSSLASDLSPDQLRGYYDQIVTLFITWTPKVLGALFILIIGWWIIGRISRLIESILAKTDGDETLERFASSLVSMLLKAVLVIAVADMVGIATTSFVAMIGAAGLAVGLALQGSLANFAGGVLILIFRPFKIGDFIEAQGVMGTVQSIQIFSTILNTPDNKRIVIPNGPLSNDVITNFSAERTRRVDITFGIGYDDDLKQAKAILEEVIQSDERILNVPAPLIAVSNLGDSAVDIVTRSWVSKSDYWGVYFDLTENVKLRFDAEGISIPYPQQDVHLKQASAG